MQKYDHAGGSALATVGDAAETELADSDLEDRSRVSAAGDDSDAADAATAASAAAAATELNDTLACLAMLATGVCTAADDDTAAGDDEDDAVGESTEANVR